MFMFFCHVLGGFALNVWYVSDGYGGRRSALFATLAGLTLRLGERRNSHPEDFDEYGNYLHDDDIVCEEVLGA